VLPSRPSAQIDENDLALEQQQDCLIEVRYFIPVSRGADPDPVKPQGRTPIKRISYPLTKQRTYSRTILKVRYTPTITAEH
jgi:hypothetical protein